jgi:ComF family protein
VIQQPGAALRATVIQWSRVFLDLIFPPSCVGCGERGVDWCDQCNQSLQRLSAPICKHCGSPLPTSKSKCTRCADFPTILSVRSYATYGGSLLKAILHLKYRPNKRLAEIMGNWLVDLVIQERIEADRIVTVPLGRKRLRQRGYNQVDLIADQMASRLGITNDKKALRRIRETRSQVGLDLAYRHKNVQDAFRADPLRLQNQKVILVDDLFTTGATLLACTSALREAGVRRVYGFTLARA